MKTILHLIVSAILVVTFSNILGGVYVSSFITAIVVATVIALLNIFVKPVLVLFTLPVTVFTFGLFLLVINAIIILICDSLVKGFRVDSFWWALLFSLMLSVGQSALLAITKKSDRSSPDQH
jgi:putative membrane protein